MQHSWHGFALPPHVEELQHGHGYVIQTTFPPPPFSHTIFFKGVILQTTFRVRSLEYARSTSATDFTATSGSCCPASDEAEWQLRLWQHWRDCMLTLAFFPKRCWEVGVWNNEMLSLMGFFRWWLVAWVRSFLPPIDLQDTERAKPQPVSQP